MDPSYASSDDEADVMAAAMGFSSFGTQGPPKKRKFNPKSDAFIEGQDLEAVDKGGKKGQGSGGNQIPLGRPRQLGVPSQAPTGAAKNDEEIALDDDEGPQYVDEGDDGPRYLDTSRPPPIMDGIGRNEDEILLDEDEDEQGPGYVDTSLPPPNQAAQEAQEKIDAILSSTGSSAAPVPPKQKQKAKKPQSSGLGAFMNALRTPVVAPPGSSIAPAPGTTTILQTPAVASLPQRPPPPSPSTMGPPGVSVGRGQNAGQRGQRNELWYIGYYDPSFNDNPWRGLEKENGLPEVGTWVERPQRGQGQGQTA
ncbi:hypothetical protein VE01_07370 [Pseudogymnoascus verrucosus]|uniref:Uncharacterized protein n=1 Tax=Pseudogymnoascus verrucosus TaxID=342668 RepID=A0A1B8GGS0_9PEZI|nr:uncharacterized protein VE01_07370 [Pseudogymnoascus verrucosus]OBT95039.1 hypothetical protein VE01_07370 [Pseudogymnoascus verrucosus]